MLLAESQVFFMLRRLVLLLLLLLALGLLLLLLPWTNTIATMVQEKCSYYTAHRVQQVTRTTRGVLYSYPFFVDFSSVHGQFTPRQESLILLYFP